MGKLMKVAESGMPDEKLWDTFFKADDILQKMGLSRKFKDIADFGSGYGTFTIPAAKIVSGKVYAIDVEPEMIEYLKAKIEQQGPNNIKPILQDIEAETSNLKEESVDYVMLFNILHGNTPKRLLVEAHRILKPQGIAGVIHWNYDSTTPRGPPMEIRLKPEQIVQMAKENGFKLKKQIDLKPYHYGLVLKK